MVSLLAQNGENLEGKMKPLFQRSLVWLMVCFAWCLMTTQATRASDPVLVDINTTPTNNLSAFDPGTADFPRTKEQFWTWGISLITPIIIYGFGKIPQLPRPVLPLLTPLVGLLLGVALQKLAALNLTWMDMAQAGTVAVFIRESVNQLVTKQLRPLEGSKTKSQPVDDGITVKAGERAPLDATPGETVKPKNL